MNRGILPEGYYALSEQHGGLNIPGVMTRGRTDQGDVSRRNTSHASFQHVLAFRRSPGDHLVAIVEIDSRGKGDRLDAKVRAAVACGIHLLIIDVQTSGRRGLSDEVLLFIAPQTHVSLPLDTTYAAAFRGMLSVYQGILA